MIKSFTCRHQELLKKQQLICYPISMTENLYGLTLEQLQAWMRENGKSRFEPRRFLNGSIKLKYLLLMR